MTDKKIKSLMEGENIFASSVSLRLTPSPEGEWKCRVEIIYSCRMEIFYGWMTIRRQYFL